MPDTLDDHDQALITRAIDDPDAFQMLYQQYFRRIYGYVASRIGDPHDAEDVVSEIFLRVIKNLDQLRHPQHTSFAAWLFVIARNTITDHYRRSGRSETVISLQVAEMLPAAEAGPERIASDLEDAMQLHQMVIMLPGRMREIVMLKYYAGLRNQEIAVVLGIGEKTVSAYLSRALQELRERYAATAGQGADENER